MKVSFKILLFQLNHVLNNSLKTGIFPDAWKTAIVTALFKSGQHNDPQNYRPIGKIMEKLVHVLYNAYLEENKIFNDIQHGFRKNKSTTDAIENFLAKYTKTQIKINTQ